MVSVLPAHIAHEMKTEMLRKTRKAQMKSMIVNQENNSQDVYTKKSTIFQNILSSASRRIGSSTRNKSSFVKMNSVQSSSLQRSLSLNNERHSTTTSISRNRIFYENNRPKTSAFHDLHIKAHNNVR